MATRDVTSFFRMSEIARIAKRGEQSSMSYEPKLADFKFAAREAGTPEKYVSTVASAANNYWLETRFKGVKPRKLTERKKLKLRPADKISGSSVILGFRGGKKLKISKAKWRQMLKKHHEPHAVAALELARKKTTRPNSSRKSSARKTRKYHVEFHKGARKISFADVEAANVAKAAVIAKRKLSSVRGATHFVIHRWASPSIPLLKMTRSGAVELSETLK